MESTKVYLLQRANIYGMLIPLSIYQTLQGAKAALSGKGEWQSIYVAGRGNFWRYDTTYDDSIGAYFIEELDYFG